MTGKPVAAERAKGVRTDWSPVFLYRNVAHPTGDAEEYPYEQDGGDIVVDRFLGKSRLVDQRETLTHLLFFETLETLASIVLLVRSLYLASTSLRSVMRAL